MKRVRFSYDAPGATQVFLAGDFTEWEQHALPMRRSKTSGSFVATVLLPEGRHEYKFIVDGRWVEDPAAPETVHNSFGTRNSRVTVQASRGRSSAAAA